MNDPHYLVPQHKEGAETDIVHAITADDLDDADTLFVDAKDRLMKVAKWGVYSGISSVQFSLADNHGRHVSRRTHRGDHIVITSNPAAGLPMAQEYDWLTIDALEYDDYPDQNRETFAIRLHITDADDTTTATIVIERLGKVVTTTYHGRNNSTDEPDMWHGLEDADWAALMKGLLESDEI